MQVGTPLLQITLLIMVSAIVASTAGLVIVRLVHNDRRTSLPEGWRFAMALVTGLLGAAIAWRFGLTWTLPVFLLLPVFGVVLAAIDLRSKLLPNRIVFSFAVATILLLFLSALLTEGWSALLAAGIGGISMFVLYLVLALIAPAGLGMGDVKLAGVLGLIAGYAGFQPWFVTLLGGFVLAAVVGIALLVLAGASRKRLFPFGPVMLAAAVAAVLGWA